MSSTLFPALGGRNVEPSDFGWGKTSAPCGLRIAWAVVTSAGTRLAHLRLNAAGISPTTLVTVEDVAAGNQRLTATCAPRNYSLSRRSIASSLKTRYPASNPDTPQECWSRRFVVYLATCRYVTWVIWRRSCVDRELSVTSKPSIAAPDARRSRRMLRASLVYR